MCISQPDQFTSKLIWLRNTHAVFSRKNWFKGVPAADTKIEDIAWFLPDGTHMEERHWKQNFAKSVAIYLNGKGIQSVDSNGNRVIDDNFYLIFNAHTEGLDYKMPEEAYGSLWQLIIDTRQAEDPDQLEYKPGDIIHVEGRSVVLLQNKTDHHG